jgi:hypothetical protein
VRQISTIPKELDIRAATTDLIAIERSALVLCRKQSLPVRRPVAAETSLV